MIAPKPARHTKPKVSEAAKSRNGNEDYTRLIANAGRAGGLEVRDLVNVVIHEAGLDGEAVRDVRVLEQFSLLSVPEDEAERVVEAGTEVAGNQRTLRRLGTP